MILSVNRIMKIVAALFFQNSRVFYTVSGKVSSVVAPSALLVETILRIVSSFATTIAFNVTGVRVFSDHVLALVGRFIGLSMSG